MVEPTEWKTWASSTASATAMIAIRHEIGAVETVEWSVEDSPLRHAPHPAADVVTDAWDRGTRVSRVALPGGGSAGDKYWPPVSRIDSAYGDRNLMSLVSAALATRMTEARP